MKVPRCWKDFCIAMAALDPVTPVRTSQMEVPGAFGEFAKVMEVILVDDLRGRKIYTTDGDLIAEVTREDFEKNLERRRNQASK